MPLPYFHIGSENYWVGDRSPSTEPAYFASIKTGLPLNAVMLSRTSISQTVMNLDLIYEPYHDYPVLPFYISDKPILMMYAIKATLSENEKRLIDHSVLVDSNSTLRFYKFYPYTIPVLLEKARNRMILELEFYNDTAERGFYYYETYQDRPSGQYLADITRKTEFFNCQVPDTGKYMVSFLYQGALQDLYPRTNYHVHRIDSTGKSYANYQSDFFRQTVLRDGNWGLVEFPLDIKAPDGRLILSCNNRYLPWGEVVIDNVLIRPAGSKIRVNDGGRIGINNRYLTSAN